MDDSEGRRIDFRNTLILMTSNVGTEVAIFTRVGVTRIMRYAFKLAQSRPRKLLTVVTKLRGRVGMDLRDRRLDQHPFGSGTGAQRLEKPFPCLGAVHRRN
ncbi:hypothetical protein VB636_21995, partial [Paracoccus sp. APAP_BH8]